MNPSKLIRELLLIALALLAYAGCSTDTSVLPPYEDSAAPAPGSCGAMDSITIKGLTSWSPDGSSIASSLTYSRLGDVWIIRIK